MGGDNMNVGDLIKNIRKINNLTQNQFAKKFFVTPKTISNYENGLRSPDLEFLNKVCDEFNLTIDYFVKSPKTESDPKDLVISEKNGKYAIYDKGQSVYLTPHIYTKIILSAYNYHIGIIAKNLIDEENQVIKGYGEVVYSAIIDNFGNVVEVSDLNFLYSYPFNMFGVCNAKDKKDGKVYLVNHKGEKISKPYDSIRPVDSWNSIRHKDYDLGLYYGLKYKENRKEEDSITAATLLYFDGHEINVTIRDLNDPFAFLEIEEFASIDVVLDYIRRYGPNIMAICPSTIFLKGENYPKIFSAVCDYYKNLNENVQSFKSLNQILNYTMTILQEYANGDLHPTTEMPVPTKIDEMLDSIPGASLQRNKFYNLYDKIGLMHFGIDASEFMNRLTQRLEKNDFRVFKVNGKEKIKIACADDFEKYQDGYRFDSQDGERVILRWKKIFDDIRSDTDAYVIAKETTFGYPIIALATERDYPVCFMKQNDMPRFIASSFDKFIDILKAIDKMINVEHQDKVAIQNYVRKLDEDYKTNGFYQLICADVIG